MENLSLFKCKNCGEPLDIRTAKDGVIVCAYCNCVYTLPKDDVTPEARSFIRMGEHGLDTCNWDGAISAFKKAGESCRYEPEIYWGLALANYKVQYVKDVVNNRLQPICHEISSRKFSESVNYRKATELATPSQRSEYEKKAAEIDYVKQEFYRLKNTGLNFDSFICVKVTDENGEKTEDYKDAEYIYDLLKGKGYSPFFSERSIRNRTGADYEAMILYALYTCETMLVVCRNQDYLQTPWVKNEYTRFLKLINDEEKECDSLTFVYYENPIDRLPGRQGKLQGIDFSRRDADETIVGFVEQHTPESRARREEERRKKAEEAEAQEQRIKQMQEQQEKQQRDFEEQKRLLEEERIKQNKKLEEQQKLLEEQLNMLKNTPSDPPETSTPKSSSRLNRLFEKIEGVRSDWEREKADWERKKADLEQIKAEREETARERKKAERKRKKAEKKYSAEQSESDGDIKFESLSISDGGYKNKKYDYNGRSKIEILLICLFLGCFGVHNFLMGEIKKGIFKIFTCCFYGLGFIFVLLDLIKIATDSYKRDPNGII
ncbi:MAG: NINE protein [Candidatus Coproplasma sp.]